MAPAEWRVVTAMTFVDLLSALYLDHDVAALDRLYLHRAIRRQRGGRLFGRSAIRQAILSDLARFEGWDVTIHAGTDTFVDLEWLSPDGVRVRRHHWAWYENDRIAADVVITQGKAETPLSTHHGLLGELDSGRGQIGPGPLSGFSETCCQLHTLWNGRSLASLKQLYHDGLVWQGPEDRGGLRDLKAWWLKQFLTYPQSHIIFEREVAFGGHIALLWQWGRIDGQGVRTRVTGSSLLNILDGRIAVETLLTDEG